MVWPGKRNKYGAHRIITEDGAFDSKREYERWRELRLLEFGGVIRELQRQVKFNLSVPELLTGEPQIIGRYVADFTYWEKERLVIEDLKSPATERNALWRWKRKHLKAQYGVEVRVTF